MRVLIDYRSALRHPSGAGEYAHQLVRALLGVQTDNRPEIALFSSSWKDRLRLSADIERARAIDRRIPVSLLNFAWHRLEWPPVERLASGGFDVAHSMHPLIMPTRAAARVVTIHDLNFLAHPERTRAEIRRDYPQLARAHAQRADRVIVSSGFTAGEVSRQLGVPRGHISVCPPGAPPWTPRASQPREGYILFLGTLEPRKNVGTLLDAYERLVLERQSLPALPALPDLVLAGQPTPAAQPWLERIARRPLDGRVRALGYVGADTLQDLYNGARMLVLPSFEEGFGMPVLEAMTLGVPVVASNRGSLPEVLGDAGLLVDPEDGGDLAAALVRMLREEGLAESCAARGIERARRYDWSATASEMIEAYRQAMAARDDRQAACASA